MKKLTPRVLRVVPVLFALACGTGDEPQSGAQSPEAADRFEKVDPITLANSAFVPRSTGSRREVFVVKLSGDPVARVQARAGVALRANEKAAARDRVVLEQAAVEPLILALGGRVKARYRDAYNGLRVEIETSQLSALRALPGVVSVHRLQLFEPNNVNGVQRVAAQAAWTPFAGIDGLRGEGVKIAIIDSGIDYTHADFGGPGTPEAYQAAFAAGTLPADPALFGPDAAKVKGGIDLAGDDYNASDPATEVPQPDLNPLDCGGHGTHVAGTAGGFGVLADGTTFAGPYGDTTFTSNNFAIGPGVAPEAELYAVRVFGCGGSTNLVVDALDWAVANDMDVVNMSLGSAFGSPDDPSAEASDNAVKAGVIVVASAGNSGVVSFITGSPAASSSAISVAAQDPTPSFPGVDLAAPGQPAIQTINANGAPVASGGLEVKVLLDASGNVLLGCDPNEYQDVAGKLVVTKRGVCARVDRAIFGQQAGAAAVLMINTAAQLPPFEGPITGISDTGEPFTVTIPFLGASLSSEAALKALDGQALGLATTVIANPGLDTLAGFSSLGPRLTDGHLKPDVTAPGLAILSAGIASGNRGAVFSGTSMAAPHTAGLAALARQAHPGWSASQIKAAIVNTGSPADVVDYPTRRAGSGLVNAAAAVRTNAVAWSDAQEVHMSLGVLEQKVDYLSTKTIRVRNRGTSAITFNLTTERSQGSPHTVTLNPTTINVPPDNTFTVNVTIAIDTATSGDSSAFREAAGLLLLSPANGTNNDVALRVPYYAVLRPVANVKAAVQPRLSPNWSSAFARLTNANSDIGGTADFYAWGLSDASEQQGYVDIRAVGVQSSTTETGQLIVFAVNMNRPWFTPSLVEVDIPIDTNFDGQADFIVIGVDLGQLSTPPFFDGRIASAVLNVATGEISTLFLASAPTNTSTILLPIDAAQIGVTPENPRFSYRVETFDLNSADTDSTADSAIFNAFSSSVSQGDFVSVAPSEVVFVPVSLDSDEQALSPALGHMIVTVDNRGAREAGLVPLR